MTKHDPRPPLTDLRWHTCTADDPWSEETGKRARHPDATVQSPGVMACPNCGITFPQS